MNRFLRWLQKYSLVTTILVLGIIFSVAGLIKKQVKQMENMKAPALAYMFKSAPEGETYSADESVDDTVSSSSAITAITPVVTPAVTGTAATETDQTASSTGSIFQEVDDSYFSDAAFVGDSRIEDLAIYVPELDKEATFYGKASLTVHDVLTEECTSDGLTAEQGLTQNQYGKVYLLVGINEAGYGDDQEWANDYRSVVDRVRELQPDALIFIMGNSHISREIEGDDNIYNSQIDARNELISQIANNQDIFYFDLYDGLDDEDGYLDSDITWDGMHLIASEYYRIYDIIKAHGVVKSDLTAAGTESSSTSGTSNTNGTSSTNGTNSTSGTNSTNSSNSSTGTSSNGSSNSSSSSGSSSNNSSSSSGSSKNSSSSSGSSSGSTSPYANKTYDSDDDDYDSDYDEDYDSDYDSDYDEDYDYDYDSDYDDNY